MIPKIDTIPHQELVKQNGWKYSLVITAELEKMKFSTGDVYNVNAARNHITTTAYFRSAAIINKNDFNAQKMHLKEFTSALDSRLKFKSRRGQENIQVR